MKLSSLGVDESQRRDRGSSYGVRASTHRLLAVGGPAAAKGRGEC